MAATQEEDERCPEMEVWRPEQGDGSRQVTQKPEKIRVKLVLYHWSQSFCSQKVRLVIAEKGLKCEEYDVNLPLSEHNEPWFMRLNPAGEVPVLIHGNNIICDSTQIIDHLENTFEDANIPKLMPEEGSLYYPRVQHYRELLDSLPMDAYTHGCILHPELTLDSMIPAYATTRIRSQIGNTESELKKLAQEHPELREAYLTKQKQIKSKIRDHDNVNYLKKIFRELENVLDQVETELQRRIEETPEEGHQPWLCGEFFSLADVSLSVTLHRLKFLGLARKYWGNGKRPNLESYYDRVLKQRTFRKVLGNVNNILLSAVLPTAFRVAKKRAPSFLGASFIVSLLGGIGYLAFLFLKKRLS
ncbi:ganglioside-induced differentiation-associated protein 1 isoform X2 [Heterodontus francisci]|uniref:ganglioside-induced differentiation-associated protein 1 isoform X2 n=2 Tax=Heterodontus francisci TaxID=7792 RepID=UPI00355AE1D2